MMMMKGTLQTKSTLISLLLVLNTIQTNDCQWLLDDLVNKLVGTDFVSTTIIPMIAGIRQKPQWQQSSFHWTKIYRKTVCGVVDNWQNYYNHAYGGLEEDLQQNYPKKERNTSHRFSFSIFSCRFHSLFASSFLSLFIPSRFLFSLSLFSLLILLFFSTPLFYNDKSNVCSLWMKWGPLTNYFHGLQDGWAVGFVLSMIA